MDSWRDLDLTVKCDRQAALVEEIVREPLICSCSLGIQYHSIVICKLVELLLIDEAESLIDQDVSVLCLIASLGLHDLLHGRIVGKLPHLGLEMLVFLLRNY